VAAQLVASQEGLSSLSKQVSKYLWLYSRFVGPWPLFSFLILYTVGRTSWTGDQPVSRPLPTHRTTRTQNKRTKTLMPLVGLEPMTPVFKWAKTFHALDRAAPMIGCWLFKHAISIETM
jgi:hypothetical protein